MCLESGTRFVKTSYSYFGYSNSFVCTGRYILTLTLFALAIQCVRLHFIFKQVYIQLKTSP